MIALPSALVGRVGAFLDNLAHAEIMDVNPQTLVNEITNEDVCELSRLWEMVVRSWENAHPHEHNEAALTLAN
jgi:hypothetical protein